MDKQTRDRKRERVDGRERQKERRYGRFVANLDVERGTLLTGLIIAPHKI